MRRKLALNLLQPKQHSPWYNSPELKKAHQGTLLQRDKTAN